MMSGVTYEKFLPEGIPGWQMPFWDSLREQQARVQRCDDCGTYVFIPKERCPSCRSAAMTWAPISGRGAVYTYTVVYRAPTPAYQGETPYVIAHVAMEEGFRMASNLRGVDPTEVGIGMPVRLIYHAVTPQWTLFEFSAA